MLAVEDEVSEIAREFREAGKEVRQVTLEWIRTEAKAPREMDAARSGVAWMAASRDQSSKAEVGLSDVSRVHFDCMARWRTETLRATLEPRRKRKAVIQKESAETQDYVSCQDMETDDNKSLEQLGFVPSAVGELLRVKHMSDQKCDEKGLKF